jgi:hypothetical protein
MPRKAIPSVSEGRTYTLPSATCAIRSLAPDTQREGALLPQHSQPQPLPGLLGAGHTGSGGLTRRPLHLSRGALLLRYLQLRAFARTPIPGTLSAGRPRVDGRISRPVTSR